jgi:hypothetical protein
MSIRILTDDSAKLLIDFIAAIDEGEIETWSYDDDEDFTHDVPQWKYAAWLRPRTEATALVFNILGNTTKAMSKEVYAVYHGRIAESFLAHFDERIADIVLSALPDSEDQIS